MSKNKKLKEELSNEDESSMSIIIKTSDIKEKSKLKKVFNKIEYLEAIWMSPQLAQTYSNLGTLLTQLEKYEEAEEYFHRALEISSKFAETYKHCSKAILSGETEELQKAFMETDDKFRDEIDKLLEKIQIKNENMDKLQKKIDRSHEKSAANLNRIDKKIQEIENTLI